ncbi:MAG: hypothetical protein RLY20_2481 [Verrucomicrobiota bacterium]|jgi:hypothetical protein
MNAADFDAQFDRLTGHFHLPAESKRETVALDWFKAVEHYEIAALDRAVTELIRASQDRFWPALGKVLGLLQSKVDRYDRGGKCATCHGSSWIESAPFKSNGMIYEGVCLRCPDCGVPPPAYNTPNNRSSLTAAEYREWSQREQQPNYMPDGLQAKPTREGEVSEMKAAMDRLRIKLFGRDHAKGDAA